MVATVEKHKYQQHLQQPTNEHVNESNNDQLQTDATKRLCKDGYIYGRTSNRGSAVRTRYSDSDKIDLIDAYEIWMEDNSNKKLPNYIKEKRLRLCFKDYLGSGKAKG